MPERPDQQPLGGDADQAGQDDCNHQPDCNRHAGGYQCPGHKHSQGSGVADGEIHCIGGAKNDHDAEREQGIGRAAHDPRDDDGGKVTHGPAPILNCAANVLTCCQTCEDALALVDRRTLNKVASALRYFVRHPAHTAYHSFSLSTASPMMFHLPPEICTRCNDVVPKCCLGEYVTGGTMPVS